MIQRHFRPSRRWAGHIIGMALSMAFLPAQAAIQEVLIDVHADGTPNFDRQHGPGFDQNPHNRIVRTHDDLTYRVTLSTNSPETGLRLQLMLPQPAGSAQPPTRWRYLPRECQPGSTLGRDGQLIDCLLGDFSRSGTLSFLFTATVQGSAAHGTVLVSPTVTARSSTTSPLQPDRPAPSVQVSAAPFYDVQISQSSHGTPAAYGYQPGSGPAGENGFFHRPLVGLMARHPNGHGSKGVEQLDPRTPVEIELDLAGYPPSVRINNWSTNPPPPHKPATQSFTDGCGSAAHGEPGSLAGGYIGLTGRVRDTGPSSHHGEFFVANGGDCDVIASDRETLRLSIRGIDTSLTHRPSLFWSNRSLIPQDEWWVANKGVVLWTNESDYTDNQRIPHELRLRRVHGRSLSGQALIEGRANNNQLQYNILHANSAYVSLQYLVDKTLPPPLASVRDPRATGRPVVNELAPGQVVTASLRIWNNGTRPQQDVQLCQIIDRTAFDLAPGHAIVMRGHHKHARLRYGTHAHGNPYFSSTDAAAGSTDAAGRPQAGTSAYAQASCDSPDIQWFDSAEEAEAAGGLVYVQAQSPVLPVRQSIYVDVQGLRLRQAWGASIEVQTPKRQLRQAGATIAEGTVIRTRALVRTASMPRLGDGPGFWDHLSVVNGRTVSRVALAITQPANALHTPVSAGSTLSLSLTPRYATQYPPQAHPLTITSILPPGLRYVHDSARMAGQALAPDIRLHEPAPGMTTLSWTLPPSPPHVGEDGHASAALPAIEWQARASQLLPDSSQLRLHASISGGRNDFEADCSFDTTRSSFGACAKSASIQTTVQSTPGFFLEKSVSREQIEPGDAFGFTISFVSIGSDILGTDLPDVIDILPFDGDGEPRPAHSFSARQPASLLQPGAYTLTRVEPPALDPQALIYYTRHPPRDIHNDPRHPSNQLPGGSTRWCLARELGSPGCPAGVGKSTAVRVHPTIPALPSGTPYDITLHLKADPIRSRHGDRFANRAGTRPVHPDSRLLYVESQSGLQVNVASSPASLSGRLYVDLDRNGQPGADDAPLTGRCVSLTGHTLAGEAIRIATRSDEHGHYRFAADAAPIFEQAHCDGARLSRFGGLPSGTYALETTPMTNTPGDGEAQAQVGSLGGQARGARIEGIILNRGAHGQNYDFYSQPQLPRLTLQASIRNDHGGQARNGDLILGVNGNGLTREAKADDLMLSRMLLPPGRYTLTHNTLPRYQHGSWQCLINGQPHHTNGHLQLKHGDDATCQLAYDDLPARLSLQATVTNSHGRTARPADFTLKADGPTPLSGAGDSAEVRAIAVQPGRYRLSHSSRPGYVPGSWQCSAGILEEDTLTLAQGEDATCSVNHTDQPVSLTLALTIDNRHGGTATPADLPLAADGPVPIQGITGSRPVTVAPVRPGVYELDEPQLPGYLAGKWVCSAGRLEGNTLHLSDQQNVTCRVELKDIPPSFTLTKSVSQPPTSVAGTEGDFQVGYQITVRHTGGADGIYTLHDQPAFDPDVQIISARLRRNGQTIEVLDTGHGWRLAEQRRLPIGAEDQYQLDLHIRLPFGSPHHNDRCQTGDSPEGHGLLNRLRLEALGLDSPQTARACIDTPVPTLKARLSLDKHSPVHHAELGDLVSYRLRIRNHGDGPAMRPVIVDRLPHGFVLDPGSVRVRHARLLDTRLEGTRVLRLTLDRIAPGGHDAVEISYRLRVGVGAHLGDGINRAHVECLTPQGGLTACSNEARWRLQTSAGIFSEETCLAGQVFVDCNGDARKQAHEPGIPGVRFYLQNGTWLTSDVDGKYSLCGLRPRTHVMKVDSRTLPAGSQLITSSPQNGGDALSLFIDARRGLLHRADFIEGSCQPQVLAEVAQRRQRAATQPPAEHSLPSASDHRPRAASPATRAATRTFDSLGRLDHLNLD